MFLTLSCYSGEMLERAQFGPADIVSANGFNATAARQGWPVLCDATCEFTSSKLHEFLSLWRGIADNDRIPFRREMTARLLQPFMRSIALYERVAGEDGSRRWRVRLMGSTVVRFLGELTGKFLDEVVPEKFLPRWHAMGDVTLAIGLPARFLVRSDTFDKPYLVAEYFFAPLRADDRAASMVLMVGCYDGKFSWADVDVEERQHLGLPPSGYCLEPHASL